MNYGLSLWGSAVSCVVMVAGVGCSSAPSTDGARTEERLVSDVDSISRRADGRYDVQCRDGRNQIATVAQIQSGDVCTATSSDPFDVGSCQGAPMTQEEARVRFAAGATKVALGSFEEYVRGRECNAVTGCGAWQVTEASFSEGDETRSYGGGSGKVTRSLGLAVSGNRIAATLAFVAELGSPYNSHSAECDPSTSPASCKVNNSLVVRWTEPGWNEIRVGKVWSPTGVITNHCARFAESNKIVRDATSWREVQLVDLARY